MDHAQLIFTDTPGLHFEKHKLGKHMNYEASSALMDSDVIMFVVDISAPTTDEDKMIADILIQEKLKVPIILVLNKTILGECIGPPSSSMVVLVNANKSFIHKYLQSLR